MSNIHNLFVSYFPGGKFLKTIHKSSEINTAIKIVLIFNVILISLALAFSYFNIAIGEAVALSGLLLLNTICLPFTGKWVSKCS